MVEPWLRGTLQETEPLRRAVIHALELAKEDAVRWVDDFSEDELFARPFELPCVAFQMRHIVRSLDRLLTYAECRPLSELQLGALRTEMDTGSADEVRVEFREGLERAVQRIRAFDPENFTEPRSVGRKKLPTTAAGLLIHCAEHTQRHSGQMVTTAKVVVARRAERVTRGR